MAERISLVWTAHEFVPDKPTRYYGHGGKETIRLPRGAPESANMHTAAMLCDEWSLVYLIHDRLQHPGKFAAFRVALHAGPPPPDWLPGNTVDARHVGGAETLDEAKEACQRDLDELRGAA